MEPIKLLTCDDGELVALGTRWFNNNQNQVSISHWASLGHIVTITARVAVPAKHAQEIADWLESLAPSPEAVAEKLWELRTGCQWVDGATHARKGSIPPDLFLFSGGDKSLGWVLREGRNGYSWRSGDEPAQHADSLPAAKSALLAHLGLT